MLGITNRRQFLLQAPLAAAALLPGAKVFAAPALDANSVRRLASNVSGRVITPQMPDYESSRQVFNRAFERYPALIVRCVVASDVARSLAFAQSNNLQVAVRGGGHSRLGYGVCDGGIVIDLSAMKRVEVDAGKRTARAEAGALVRDLDEATQRFGLATTSGGCPTVGIAGLTLGGGEGRLMDKYGAACDNLLSAQVITVDGRQVEASADSKSSIPVTDVLSGSLIYPTGRIPELLEAFARFLAAAPDEMDALAQVLPSDSGRRLRMDLCYCGNLQTGRDLVRPLRALGPENDTLRVVSYLEAQAAGGFLQAPVAHFQTNLFLRELGGAETAAIATAVNGAPASCKLVIVPLRGAISRVRVDATAFALRQPGYEVDVAGVWSTPAEKAQVVRWVRDTRDRLWPFAHGVYVNQLGDTSEKLVKLAYGPNYARLVEIKRKYDPRNVLRLNQNIPVA